MLTALITYRYWILAPLSLFEGPLLAVVCGIGISAGYFNPLPVYGILVVGDFLPDLMYYWLGRLGTNLAFVTRYTQKNRILRENLPAIERMWHEHGLLTMCFVKLAYGFSPAFIVSAGLSHMPLRKFITDSLAVSVVLFAALVGIGYIFSEQYRSFQLFTGQAELISAFGGLSILALLFIASKYFRKRLDIKRSVKE